MPVALLLLIAVEGFRASLRQYNKRKAKKYQYDGVFGKDYLGRPIDKSTGRTLSRNEARAIAQHRRETEREALKEREWRSKGNILPEYSQATHGKQSKLSSSTQNSENDGSAHFNSNPSSESDTADNNNDDQDWQNWSIAGAPCYKEHDEVAHSSLQLIPS